MGKIHLMVVIGVADVARIDADVTGKIEQSCCKNVLKNK